MHGVRLRRTRWGWRMKLADGSDGWYDWGRNDVFGILIRFMTCEIQKSTRYVNVGLLVEGFWIHPCCPFAYISESNVSDRRTEYTRKGVTARCLERQLRETDDQGKRTSEESDAKHGENRESRLGRRCSSSWWVSCSCSSLEHPAIRVRVSVKRVSHQAGHRTHTMIHFRSYPN
jgi:hypothetical protein